MALETEVLELRIEFGLYAECMAARPGYRTGVRPNHRFPGREDCFIGQVNFIGVEILRPGESCEAVMQCVVAVKDRELFVPGFSWEVCEADEVLGFGRVLG